MNILLLVDWTYPCDHQFLTNVYAREFVNRGHNITWVMRPKDDGQEIIEKHMWNGSHVYVLPSSAFEPIRNIIRYKTGRIQSNAIFSTDIKFSDFDIVHTRNDLSMGLVAVHLKQTHGVKFAHQISHLKSESLIEESQRVRRNPVPWVKGQLGKGIRHSIAKKADLVLPISDAMKTHLIEVGYRTPMTVLPTGASVIDNPPSGDSIKQEYGIDARHLLVYIGSMSPLRRLWFLFDVLKKTVNSQSISLMMVGGRSSVHQERLKEAAKERGVETDVIFTGWINNRNEINRIISASDIGLSPLPTDSVLRTNAPIKTLEYMSLGTPVICSSTPDQSSVVKESRAGLAVDYDVSSFFEAINQILSNPKLKREMQNNGREFIRRKRNFHVLADKVEDAYQPLIDN